MRFFSGIFDYPLSLKIWVVFYSPIQKINILHFYHPPSWILAGNNVGTTSTPAPLYKYMSPTSPFWPWISKFIQKFWWPYLSSSIRSVGKKSRFSRQWIPCGIDLMMPCRLCQPTLTFLLILCRSSSSEATLSTSEGTSERGYWYSQNTWKTAKLFFRRALPAGVWKTPYLTM